MWTPEADADDGWGAWRARCSHARRELSFADSSHAMNLVLEERCSDARDSDDDDEGEGGARVVTTAADSD